MTFSLEFLSLALVKAALEGRLPRCIGAIRLCDMPAEGRGGTWRSASTHKIKRASTGKSLRIHTGMRGGGRQS
jgi:hypothetical protein